MGRVQIQQSISARQNELRAAQQELDELREKHAGLCGLLNRIEMQRGSFIDTIYRKRNRLDAAAALAGKVRAAKAYHTKMSKSLNEDDFVYATAKIDEFHDATIREKQATVRQIDNLEARIRMLSSQLSTLRYNLARCED
ncbi:MAG: hypothetical protein LBS58_03955 [Coriobacteriales bacterium]|jgi:flagellar biosynthesis chaperone FliJ|nr:hypothetical protein [Coriobacteriales bacterium]